MTRADARQRPINGGFWDRKGSVLASSRPRGKWWQRVSGNTFACGSRALDCLLRLSIRGKANAGAIETVGWHSIRAAAPGPVR